MEFPEEAFSGLRQTPEEFSQQMRVAAAAKWYELGRISQETAAELAGLSRSDFLDALRELGVPAVQSRVEELSKEVEW